MTKQEQSREWEAEAWTLEEAGCPSWADAVWQKVAALRAEEE